MRRRDFLGSTATGVATSIGVAFAGGPAVAGQSRDSNHHQSSDGIRIHPYDSQLMKGFPPTPEQSVTRTSYLKSRRHRVWAHQHMCELCTTQQISRGTGEVIPLHHAYRDVDHLMVTGSAGAKVKLIDLLRKSSTDAFLILRDGTIITEQYFSGMRPDTRHQLWSASKSISIGVVFNLLREGALKGSSYITDYIPELADSGYRGATVRHLMDMQSGIQYDYQDGDATKSELDLATTRKEGGCHFRAAGFFPRLANEQVGEGQYSFFRTLKASEDRTHGSIFYYKCCDTAVLGWACEKVTGRHFADLVSQYVWSKIGAERDAYVISDVQGACSPNAGMSVTLRDLARWGQMHAQFGNWNDDQVIPKASIEDVQQRHDPSKIKPESFLSSDNLLQNTAYRSQFWIPGVQRDAFYAGGAYGQSCYVHPKTNTVIVRFATQDPGPDSPNWTKIIPNAFSEVIKALDA